MVSTQFLAPDRGLSPVVLPPRGVMTL